MHSAVSSHMQCTVLSTALCNSQCYQQPYAIHSAVNSPTQCTVLSTVLCNTRTMLATALCKARTVLSTALCNVQCCQEPYVTQAQCCQQPFTMHSAFNSSMQCTLHNAVNSMTWKNKNQNGRLCSNSLKGYTVGRPMSKRF